MTPVAPRRSRYVCRLCGESSCIVTVPKTAPPIILKALGKSRWFHQCAQGQARDRNFTGFCYADLADNRFAATLPPLGFSAGQAPTPRPSLTPALGSPADAALETAQRAFLMGNWARASVEARRALTLMPSTADAYNVLGHLALGTRTYQEAAEHFHMAVRCGARALGLKADPAGQYAFWADLTTRPYMRGRDGYAVALHALGQIDAAIAYAAETLRLNPDDEQGIRYRLLAWCADDGDEDAVERYARAYFPVHQGTGRREEVATFALWWCAVRRRAARAATHKAFVQDAPALAKRIAPDGRARRHPHEPTLLPLLATVPAKALAGLRRALASTTRTPARAATRPTRRASTRTKPSRRS